MGKKTRYLNHLSKKKQLIYKQSTIHHHLYYGIPYVFVVNIMTLYNEFLEHEWKSMTMIADKFFIFFQSSENRYTYINWQHIYIGNNFVW